jgi:hypothetical protein
MANRCRCYSHNQTVMNELKDLLIEIDDLIAEAETTTSSTQKVKSLESALKKTCKFFKGLRRNLSSLILPMIKAGGYTSDIIALPISDIAARSADLEVYRSKETLIEFINGTRGMLKTAFGLSADQVRNILRQIDQNFDNFKNAKLAENDIDNHFEMLEGFFCRPPTGPSGEHSGILDENGGGPSRLAVVWRLLVDVSTIGAFAWPIYEKFMNSGPASMGSITFAHQVLPTLLYRGFAEGLKERGEVTEKASIVQFAVA